MNLLLKCFTSSVRWQYLLIISIILTGILYAIFYSGLLPDSVLREMTKVYTLHYDPVCHTTWFCRSLGYPFLQNIFLFFQANLLVFIYFQVLFFAFSCVFLASEFYKLTNQKILSCLLLFSIYFNPQIFKYSFHVQEEGFYLSLIIIIAALIIRFARLKNINILLLLSFVIGVAIAVRPAGYAMLPLLFIILFVYWQQFNKFRIKTLLFMFLPVLLLIFSESYLYHTNNSQDRESSAGVMLLGKVPLIGLNKPQNSEFPLLSDIAYQRGKLVREIINSMDDFALQQHLRNIFNVSYQDFEGYKPMMEQINNYEQQLGNRDAVTTGLFKEYALENPLTTLKIIGLNYIGLWQLPEILTYNQRSELSQWLQKNTIEDNFSKYKINNYFNISKRYTIVAKAAKIVMILLLLSTFYLFFKGTLRLFNSLKNKEIIDSLSFIAFILPIMLNGYFLLIAIMNNVQMRFILTYWSVLMIILFLAIHFLLNKFKKT